MLVFLSGHGSTDTNKARFFFFPYDIGRDRPARPVAGRRAAAIRFQHPVDGLASPARCRGNDVPVDTCHSASSVAPPGYKHGPFGSRGLGQLAYDKGLQVLAASQSEQVALEIRDLKHGLLTYALVQDGLAKRGAATADGTVTIGELAAVCRAAGSIAVRRGSGGTDSRIGWPGRHPRPAVQLWSCDGQGYRDVTLILGAADRDADSIASGSTPGFV